MTKNFKRSEFKCPCGCENDSISPKLVDLLQEVRDEVGPLTITSGVRCSSHSDSIGGVARSAHVPAQIDNEGRVGHAVDILCVDSASRLKLMLSLLQRFTRVGVGKSFIHVDTDARKAQNVCWTYYVADHQA